MNRCYVLKFLTTVILLMVLQIDFVASENVSGEVLANASNVTKVDAAVVEESTQRGEGLKKGKQLHSFGDKPEQPVVLLPLLQLDTVPYLQDNLPVKDFYLDPIENEQDYNNIEESEIVDYDSDVDSNRIGLYNEIWRNILHPQGVQVARIEDDEGEDSHLTQSGRQTDSMPSKSTLNKCKYRDVIIYTNKKINCDNLNKTKKDNEGVTVVYTGSKPSKTQLRKKTTQSKKSRKSPKRAKKHRSQSQKRRQEDLYWKQFMNQRKMYKQWMAYTQRMQMVHRRQYPYQEYRLRPAKQRRRNGSTLPF